MLWASNQNLETTDSRKIAVKEGKIPRSATVYRGLPLTTLRAKRDIGALIV